MSGDAKHPISVTMDRADKGWLMKLIVGAAITQSLAVVLWGWRLETRVTLLEKSAAQAEMVIREELRPVVNSMNQLIGEVRATKGK
jgi:hypothetical protein